MPFIDDFNYDDQYVGTFNSFSGGTIGDVSIAPVNTSSVDASQVEALESQAASLDNLQKQREAEEAAALRLAEEQKRTAAKAAIISDINTELSALSGLITRLNAIITLATPYKNSKFTDVASSATTIVNSANALKDTINGLITSLNTAKATASNASTAVS